jgi:glutathione synthase/RimK-type ligase-like ATP-grasp enzyme
MTPKPKSRPPASKTVAVVGSDINADYVADAVEALNARALRIDPRRAQGAPSLTWEGRSARYGDEPLGGIRCVYVKSIALGLPYFNPYERDLGRGDSWPERYVSEREQHALTTAILRSLAVQGAHFVNPVEQHDLHHLKLHQLELLARVGIEVPESLATADPEALRAFAARYKGVIYKPLAGGTLVRKLSKDDLKPARLKLLASAPVLFQEQIAGDELRVYVLDSEVVAAFVAPTQGLVDVREKLERFKPARMTREEQDICVKAAKTTGLVFSGLDVRRSKRGLVVLECNPTPAIAFHDDPRTGRVITALASHLVARA